MYVMSNKFVPKLEHLAFMASYKDIFTNLGLIHDYESKHFDGDEDDSLENETSTSFTSLYETISRVRDRLSQHLIGTMNDTTRKMFLQKLYEALREFQNEVLYIRGCSKREYWKSFFESSAPDIWVFLDCVLDDSFEELEIDAVLPYHQYPDQKVITTIANRSSSLAKLSINFTFMKPRETLDPFILSLSALQNLTSLSLHEINTGFGANNWDNKMSVFKCIGQSCPLLSYLSVSGFTVWKAVLSLIVVGELVDGIMLTKNHRETKWSLDATLQRLRVPPEYLTPLCSTLKHLHIKISKSYCYDSMNSTLAFALRHLPMLQNLDSNSMAVKIFYDTCGLIDSKMQSEFEEVCRKAKNVSNFSSALPGTTTLALTSLSTVDITNSDLLVAIGKTCPFLKDVGFEGLSSDLPNRSNKRKRSWDHAGGNFQVDLFQSILSKWPKLEAVTLNAVPPEFVRIILTAFGPSLLHLTFNSCSEINLEEVSPCVELEKLSILQPLSSLLKMPSKGNSLELDFLPKLTSFESDICLGSYWSRIFEEKSSLTRVLLDCCHIGTKASSQADWNSIPRMWPNLEIFSIRHCDDSLTMTIVWNIIAQLNGLKTIHLPERMSLDVYGQLPCISDLSTKSYTGPPSPIRFIDSRIPHDGYHDYRNTQTTSSNNISPPCPFLQLEPYYTRRSPRWNDVFYDSDDSENDHWANEIGLFDLSEIASARNDW